MVRDYVHLELGREIEAISGTYTPIKESMLNLNGRDILYVVGMAVINCCGSGSFPYATVPGQVVTWKGRIDESGLSVSQVEPVEAETIKHEIAKTIMETESINNYNVNFW